MVASSEEAAELQDLVQKWVVAGHSIDAEAVALRAIATRAKDDALDASLWGTLFQSAMPPLMRHRRGAHYTPNHAIHDYVIGPLLLEPWQARIRETTTLHDLSRVHKELIHLRILDPSCGSGNFLHVAFRALKILERDILERARDCFSAKTAATFKARGSVSTQQLFGIDNDHNAVALARMLLGLADVKSPFHDENIVCDDALFCAWPDADIIVGNPPFQSKNRMQQAFGPEYVQRLREHYPDVPGRADYCVYWFRKAHDTLKPGGSAGLVGTNTIRENDSRIGGLDYIVNHGGVIVDAVSSMVWPGEAVVHVSVVNWTKGAVQGPKTLSWQDGDQADGPWHESRLAVIPSSLSPAWDVTDAHTLRANAHSACCFQGQTHGHEGFLVVPEDARSWFSHAPRNHEVAFPYLIGNDLLSKLHGKPSRWVIDFSPQDLDQARTYVLPFQRIEECVLPDRERAARAEKKRNEALAHSGNHHHENFLRRWWHLSYPRPELMRKLANIPRYVVCSRVTKRPVFEFVSTQIHPSDALMVFPLDDDYSFGILQSALHWAWFTARCSTLTARFRYTSESVFDSFPWPQEPTNEQCVAVAKAAMNLRQLRHKLADEHRMNLRTMYAAIETPGSHPLKDAHSQLDDAVRAAYGMQAQHESLAFLLQLNRDCAERETRGEVIRGPGLPYESLREALTSNDCITPASF